MIQIIFLIAIIMLPQNTVYIQTRSKVTVKWVGDTCTTAHCSMPLIACTCMPGIQDWKGTAQDWVGISHPGPPLAMPLSLNDIFCTFFCTLMFYSNFGRQPEVHF